MRALPFVVLLVATAARAEPVTVPDAPALAQIQDDKQLAEVLSAIVQDPAVHVDDAKARPLAQALMTEGVKRLQARAYDQALANFLEAYNQLPSPKILLNVASTLRDMGRLADAANTYQRYLADPATSAERVGEVKQVLIGLDQQLTILTVRVFPRGSDVSIDGGPFVPVGSSLLTRVRPGIHLVRIKKGDASHEVTVNGFEGETKDVAASLPMAVEPDKAAPPVTATAPTPPPATAPPTSLGTNLPIETDAPDHVEGWLITGTQYGGGTATGRERRVRTGYQGPEVAPIIPHYEVSDTGETIVTTTEEEPIGSGVIGIMRIDTSGRCCAGGLGIAIALHDHLELDIAGLRSNEWGAYLGLRYRFLTGLLRPFVSGGFPLFVFTNTSDMSTQIAPGVRAGGGVEVMINGHLSVEADLGIEHFFNVDDTMFDATVWVPTVGVIGRL